MEVVTTWCRLSYIAYTVGVNNGRYIQTQLHLMCVCVGYSGSDMANVCREAAYGPVRESASSIQHISVDEVHNLSLFAMMYHVTVH